MGEVLRIDWAKRYPVLSVALEDRIRGGGPLIRLLDDAYAAAGTELIHTDDPPEAVDALSFYTCLAALPSPSARDAAFWRVVSTTDRQPPIELRYEGYVILEGQPFLFAPTGERRQALIAALDRLFDVAGNAADAGALDGLPTRHRSAIVEALDAVLEWGDPHASLGRVSCALYLMRPSSFLPLYGYARDFLIAPAGLAIDPRDLPSTAAEYLDLIQFLRREMRAADLPYADFSQMCRAAQQRIPRTNGLAAEDRLRLLEEDVRPLLLRLFPNDDRRVADECARLFDG